MLTSNPPTCTSLLHGGVYTQHSPGFISNSTTIPGAAGLLDEWQLSLRKDDFAAGREVEPGCSLGSCAPGPAHTQTHTHTYTHAHQLGFHVKDGFALGGKKM